MSTVDGRTHGVGCYAWHVGHYDCARREIERLQRELLSRVVREAPRFEQNTPARVQLAQLIERIGAALDIIDRGEDSPGARHDELRAIMRCMSMDLP